MKEKLNSLCEQTEKILNQIDTAQDLAKTLHDAVNFCIENGDNCDYIDTIIEYLVKEISKISDNTDKLQYQLLQTAISLK